MPQNTGEGRVAEAGQISGRFRIEDLPNRLTTSPEKPRDTDLCSGFTDLQGSVFSLLEADYADYLSTMSIPGTTAMPPKNAPKD